MDSGYEYLKYRTTYNNSTYKQVNKLDDAVENYVVIYNRKDKYFHPKKEKNRFVSAGLLLEAIRDACLVASSSSLCSSGS